jgi:predicted porin
MHHLRFLSAGALTLAATSVLAQSDVQFYGLVDSMVYRKQLAGEAHVVRVDSGGLSTSFWGMRGREDLGGGLRAEFDITGFFRMDVGANGRSDVDPLFSRSSWVGLHGRWGGVRMGRQSTLAFLNLVRYNALGGSSAFNPSFLHNYQSSATQPLMTASGAADSSWNNAVSYTTPNLNGFSGAVFHAPAEASTAGRRIGANLSYAQGAFSAGLVTEKISDMGLNFSKPPANVRIADSQLWSLGASYDFKAIKLFGQLIKTELQNATTRIDLETRSIGAAVPVGAGKILMSYGETARSQTAQADVNRRTTTVAYEYALSKRTDVYGVVLNDRATRLASGNGLAFGIRHRF